VHLVASFYPSRGGKDAVPVILIHGFEGSRVDYHFLAESLQAAGFAVLVPDLRGHGGSKTVAGSDDKLEAKRLNQAQLRAIITQDMEACKRFLMEKHQAGELNIDKLCLVGAELGAIVAINWAALDWSWPVLATGKQGQDVKALVLLSPQIQFSGIPLDCAEALKHPAVAREIAVYTIIGGQRGESRREAQKVQRLLAQMRRGQDDTAFYREVETSLQGTRLFELNNVKTDLATRIANFFTAFAGKKPYPWQPRRDPFAAN
jgi:alpha-beta hydrolase superfamily lysophospholipase